MAKCYVGTISGRGLESFVQETDNAVTFLARRAYRRKPPRAVCYWVVVEEDVARQVWQQMQVQRRDQAYLTLRAQAKEFGTILPPDFEDAL